MITQLHSLTWVVFALLGASLVAAIVRWTADGRMTERTSLALFLASFVLGLEEGSVSLAAAVPVGFMVLSARIFRSSGKWRWLGLGCIVVNAALVFAHQPLGFQNPIVIQELLISSDGIMYTRYLNYDKGAFAWSLLQFAGIRKPTPNQLVAGVGRLLHVLAVGPFVLLLLALLLGYLSWDPKLGAYLWIWIPTNLLFTCIAEELVFRELFLRWEVKTSVAMAMLTVSSVLFGIAHFAGGWQYVLLATAAGGFYAFAYLRTGRFVVFSVLMHFWVNLLHILLFTYPALA